jgi:hypothetical protein
MFLNSWSLALILSSLIVLFLGILACRTAVRVLKNWDPASDSNRQIRLENETWLASTLVEYGLGFQIITLVLFMLAADHFCQVIVGAMCATGALLANSWGMPTLLVKIGGVFLYGFWIVLHQLDISSENYPLVRAKFRYLLFLAPLLVTDNLLQLLYIANLSPDIITSCCAVVFGGDGQDTGNLLGGFDQTLLLAVFYGTVLCLTTTSTILIRRWNGLIAFIHAALWLFFFVVALTTITTVFSSYIYAMPFHNCPFCILKPEYHFIGFALYGALIVATFFGINVAAVGFCRKKEDLAEITARFQKMATWIALVLLMLFSVLTSYHFLLYTITGGET